MKTEAQKRAQRKYNARNPERTAYTRLKSNANCLLNPTAGTTSGAAVEWAKQDGRYKNDLLKFRALIDEQLKEL